MAFRLLTAPIFSHWWIVWSYCPYIQCPLSS
nr:MAG TPA: Chitin synthase [Caudoviricetes sp.]